jgi:Ca2+/Na+ antiporter
MNYIEILTYLIGFSIVVYGLRSKDTIMKAIAILIAFIALFPLSFIESLMAWAALLFFSFYLWPLLKYSMEQEMF